jgi:nicotinate-nucleotide adenylyltransferase
MTGGAPSGRRIAVFGGSFNPPHVGHVLVASYVLATEPVDALMVIPTFRHPFGKPLAPFDARLQMCRLALGGWKRVEISSLERDLGGDSYTVRTLEALRAREPDAALALCVGADVLAERHLWHRTDDVDRVARRIVIGRQGYENPAEASPPMPAISSTEIRRLLAAGGDVSRLVPRAVAAYIAEHGLYQDTAAG